jgi:hypothetical protein
LQLQTLHRPFQGSVLGLSFLVLPLCNHQPRRDMANILLLVLAISL